MPLDAGFASGAGVAWPGAAPAAPAGLAMGVPPGSRGPDPEAPASESSLM